MTFGVLVCRGQLLPKIIIEIVFELRDAQVDRGAGDRADRHESEASFLVLGKGDVFGEKAPNIIKATEEKWLISSNRLYR